LSPPDFLILADKQSVTFNVSEQIEKTLEKSHNPGLFEKINIRAENIQKNMLLGERNYNRPIFIYYDFVDEGGNSTKIKGITVDIKPSSILIGKTSEATIHLKDINRTLINLKDEDILSYKLRFHGRGGGESVLIGEGPSSILKFYTSGLEPEHIYTITIQIKKDLPPQQAANNTTKERAKEIGVEDKFN